MDALPSDLDEQAASPTAQTPPAWLSYDAPLARGAPTIARWLREAWSTYLADPNDRPGWTHLWAVLLLAASTMYLVSYDGGRPRGAEIVTGGLLAQLGGLLPVLVLTIPVLLTSVGEVARDRPFVRWVLLGWSVGPLIALVDAGIRDGWVRSFAALSLAVPIFLATRRVWRPRWGPAVVGAIVLLTALNAWGIGLIRWMSSANELHWPLLSWYNQTATLMGVLFLTALSIAWTARRWVRAAAVVVAALCGSALWLGASRGAFVLTVVGLTAALSLALRSPHARAAIAVTGVAIALTIPTVLIVGPLGIATTGASPAQELDDEEEVLVGSRGVLDRGTEVGNLTMRFEYWRGALGMFGSAPLTGTGPGSFAWAAPEHMRPDYYPTLSTHNEYLEVLGTMGLVGAIPVWSAALGAGWLVLLLLRQPSLREERGGRGMRPERWAGRFAATASLTLLGLHAGMDLDWLYPILIVAATTATGILHAEITEPEVTPRGSRSAIAAVAAGLALTLTTAAGVGVQRLGPAPWDLPHATQQVLAAVEADELDQAETWATHSRRWNPGSAESALTTTLVDYAAGSATAAEVEAIVDSREVRSPVQTQVRSMLDD